MQRIAWITALLAALTTPATLAARIYKWSDTQGQTHYGELPPVGRPAQMLDIQTPPGHPRPAASPPAALSETPVGADTNNQETTAQPGKSDPHAQPISRNPQPLPPSCATARQNLRFLQVGGTNRRFRDPSGNVVRYTQAQRQAKITATEQYLEEHCSAQ